MKSLYSNSEYSRALSESPTWNSPEKQDLYSIFLKAQKEYFEAGDFDISQEMRERLNELFLLDVEKEFIWLESVANLESSDVNTIKAHVQTFLDKVNALLGMCKKVASQRLSKHEDDNNTTQKSVKPISVVTSRTAPTTPMGLSKQKRRKQKKKVQYTVSQSRSESAAAAPPPPPQKKETPVSKNGYFSLEDLKKLY